MRFLRSLVGFYASLLSAYIDNPEAPVRETHWTDGT